MFSGKKIALLLAATVLAGCASSKTDTSIYGWEGYQPAIHDYYQQDKVGPEQQIAALNETIEKTKAKNKLVPPGLHAQLGLLYSNTGHGTEARQQFELEKAQFPESAAYMDFLLSKNKGASK